MALKNLLTTFAACMLTCSTGVAQEVAPVNQAQPANAPHGEVVLYRNTKPLLSDPKLAPLVKAAAGHYISIIRFHEFPMDKELVVSICRPLINPDLYHPTTRFIIRKDKGPTFNWLTSSGYLPGEKILWRCEAADGSLKYETSLTPNPISVNSKSKTFSLEAELHHLEMNQYEIQFSGLTEGDKLTIETISGREKIEGALIYSSKNSFILLPAVQGKKSGVCKVCITNASGDRLRFSLPWGSQLTNYLKGDLVYRPSRPKKVGIPSVPA